MVKEKISCHIRNGNLKKSMVRKKDQACNGVGEVLFTPLHPNTSILQHIDNSFMN